MPIPRPTLAALIFLPLLLLTACATPTPGSGESTTGTRTVGNRTSTTIVAAGTATAPTVAEVNAEAAERARIYKGTGVLVKGQLPGGGLPAGSPVQTGGGGVVLNFEGADLREVIRNILGDILGESYTIDPSVGGQVTIRTSSGIPRDALPATLEMLLRMNGASMVKEGSLYKIVPQAAAVRGNAVPQLGTSNRALPPGYSVQIVPLRYVGVKEMVRLLEPFAKDAQAVRFDELRNLMILSGTERELKYLLEAIDMFDIDWMAGMSVGVFVLQRSDVKTVMQELDKVLGDKNTSPFAGILRIVPIERMNALLIITPQPAYLDEARKWIARLDQAGTGEGPQFYVYNLENQRADKLGPLLQQAFTGRAAGPAAATTPTLAPGTPPGSIVNPPSFQQQPTNQPQPLATAIATAASAVESARTSRQATGAAEGTGIVRNIQVVADKDNNTLLIVATPVEYAVIEAAVRRLDVPSRQVMIEVTVANVTLNDEIDFGIDWLFRGGAPSGRGSGGLIVGSGSTAGNPALPVGSGTTAVNPALGIAQGFTYIINNANFPGGVQAVLRLLDTYGDTKVIANPHLAALDNQKATIKAGDKIPLCQQTFVGTGVGTGVNGAVSTTSQYIDTGVLMQVTPHINAGGLVTLEVEVVVSVPGELPKTCEGLAPAIDTRSLQSILNVQSGQTMVMGGLITDNKQNKSQGLPLLSRIPIIGGLFGQQTLINNRTELVMFITPRVVETEVDLKDVVDDLRRRMEQVDDAFDVFKRQKSPVSGGAPGKP